MADIWTTQRVLDLAPDTPSVKAGQGQAKASKWPVLGRSGASLWGHAQGSGKKPYQVRIDLREPAFKCSCPSRKFPCKHALGLLLIYANQQDAVAERDLPDWVSEWLASRDQRAEKQQAKAKAKSEQPADPEAQAKRIAKRDAKVRAGVEELGRFLSDVLRQGLATAQTQPNSYWEQVASRMIDAQAPGLAGRVRQLGQAVGSGNHWQSRFLRSLGRLHLAVQGYSRIEHLPEAAQADLRGVIGWTQTRDELLPLPSAKGLWNIVGQQTEQEDRITTQRTWLMRQADGQPALVLHFAAGNQPMDTSLMPGTAFQGELIYYPSASPLRAIVKSREGEPKGIANPPGAESIDQSLSAYVGALANNPWLDRWPIALSAVVPVAERVGKSSAIRWIVRDQAGDALPLHPQYDEGWKLLSISGGRPVWLAGEWDGSHLTPLSVCADGVTFIDRRGSQRARLARVS